MTWPATAVVDPVAALVAHLRVAVPGLASRVYGDRLPGSEAEAMPRQGAVVRQAGGPGAARHAPLLQLRVDVHAYGATPLLAADAYWQLHAALNDMRRVTVGGTLLHSATHESGPIAQTDPATEWPEVVSSWVLLAAERVPA